MNSFGTIDDVLACRNRGLRTRPGTSLLGPTGARLWADYLEPSPGFVGAIDFIHKLNIPLLFTVDGVELPPPWETEWRPSHLIAVAAHQGVELTERKFVSWDDCAVSVQQWTNVGKQPVRLRLRAAEWVRDGYGERSIERHGFTVRVVVCASPSDLASGLDLAPGTSLNVVVAAAVGTDRDDWRSLAHRLQPFVGEPAREHLPRPAGREVVGRQEREYQSWYDDVPRFSSSDRVLDRAWAYRWFLLRHNLAVPGIEPLPGPLFYEGRGHKMSKDPWEPTGWEFSKLIPLSSPMHLLDVRWHPDSALGEGLLRTLRSAQGEDGLFASQTISERFHAYANFLGWASYRYALVHRDLAEIRSTHAALRNQVLGERELLGSGEDELLVETNHILTGKEYQPSYWYFGGYPDDPRDRSGYTPLKRVDRAVYHYLNARGVAGLGRLAGIADGHDLDALADQIARDVLAKQWDEETGFFYDVHPTRDERAMVRNVVGFYPYWAKLTDESHLEGFERAMTAFDTPSPFPSVAPDCPVFSPTGSWRGIYVKGRNGCSWNGPSWPYTNSVVLDALAETSRRFGHRYDDLFATHLRRFALQHFRDRDGRTPYLVEHYDSLTGEPISDEPDYSHSYFIDLVVRQVVGLEVAENHICIDPIDIGLEHFALTGVHVAGHVVDIDYRRHSGLTITVDGTVAAAATGPLQVPLGG